MQESKAKITFEGPFGLCGDHSKLLFNEDISHSAGIYLWTFKFKERYLIDYIGETGKSFYQRMKDHMIQQMGGNYRICDPKALMNGKEKIIWNGLWRKRHVG